MAESLTTGKVVEAMFEKAVETYEQQDSMLPLVEFKEPDGGAMQNAGNVIWTPVQQHAPIIEGWDLTDEETGIIEETYPSILGTPKNDLIEQRADNMRTLRFWERRGEQSARKQVSEQNKSIAAAIATQGSLFYRSSVTSGYDFIAEAQAMMNERQLYQSERFFLLNDRDNLKFSKDLASRETIKGRPEYTWKTGMVGMDVAGFAGVYAGSYLPNLTGGASPDTTVTGDHTFSPEAGSVNTSTGVVTNVDYRLASIVVAASADYNVGDKVVFTNTATTVTALALADKIDTGQDMTFTVVGKPDATHIQIYPKPIALDDTGNLDTLELAYANIDTQILDAATVERQNTDASAKTNIFWDKSAVEVLGGTIPVNLFKQFAGFKALSRKMPNGQTMYMVYDGDIITMTFRYRIFTWYGITIPVPANCGVAVAYSA